MGETAKIPVLIVDRDVDCRDLIARAFRDNVDIEVVDTAPNGTIGLMKAAGSRPEVIILDAEIDDCTTREFMERLSFELGPCGIILTLRTDVEKSVLVDVLKCLESGAFDFIIKPEKKEITENRIDLLRRRLMVRIRAYSIRRYSRLAMQYSDGEAGKTLIVKPSPPPRLEYTFTGIVKYKILALGISTGGPQALARLLPLLPENFPLPVVIVIHLPVFFTSSLTGELNKNARVMVTEALPGEVPRPGRVYLARGGEHLLLSLSNTGQVCFRYSNRPPVNNCRPSVDVLFGSVAEVFGDRAIGVILTGMGKDGADGIRVLKQKGAATLAQDKDSSVVWGMPGAAVATGCVDKVLPLDQIIPGIMELIIHD